MTAQSEVKGAINKSGFESFTITLELNENLVMTHTDKDHYHHSKSGVGHSDVH